MNVRTMKYIFYDACNFRVSRPCSEWILRTSTATTAVLPGLWWPSQTSLCCSHCWKYDLFWFCPWELEDNFLTGVLPGFHEVQPVWVVEIFSAAGFGFTLRQWWLCNGAGCLTVILLLPLSRHTWDQKCVSQRQNAEVEGFFVRLHSFYHFWINCVFCLASEIWWWSTSLAINYTSGCGCFQSKQPTSLSLRFRFHAWN